MGGSSREPTVRSKNGKSLRMMFWENSSFLLLHPVLRMWVHFLRGLLSRSMEDGTRVSKKSEMVFLLKIFRFLKHLLMAPTETTFESKSSVSPS